MQKFCFTPSEGMFGIFFHLIFSFSNRLTSKLGRDSISRTILILASLINTIPSVSANQDHLFFLRSIQYNDDHTLDRQCIDSTYRSDQQIDLPSIWEIEMEIGHPSPDLKNSFEYRLAGFETSWNKATSSFIRYTNLKGKQYQLRIRESEASEGFRAFVFQVAEPELANIREEWWFQPLLIFSLLLILFTVAYFLALDSSRRSLRIEVVRNQIASDLHDDVGANLGAINNLTDLLKKRYDRQEERTGKVIDKIKNYTQDTITNLQDTVWAINPLNDSIGELLIKMKEFALLMLSAKNIDIKFENQYQDQFPIQLDMQQRHAMFMMFKEVINNIVKHADASKVFIHISNDRSSLTIKVEDNGKGFDPTELHRGNGLKNFHHRAKENFIDLDLQSTPGAGARTRMEIHSLA